MPEVAMKSVLLDLPTFGFILGTRAALAFGVGLLLADRLPDDRRRTIGLTLVTIGALTTIPAVASVVGNLGQTHRSVNRSVVDRDKRLMATRRFARKGDDDTL
jgi:hypothetical protein